MSCGITLTFFSSLSEHPVYISLFKGMFDVLDQCTKEANNWRLSFDSELSPRSAFARIIDRTNDLL